MAYKKWEVASGDKELASELSEKFNINPFVSLLLVSRGFNNEKSFSDFISDNDNLEDPFLLKDMDKAVNRLMKAVDNGEKITIYGDYDCDGVTATALLYSFLNAMGSDVHYYIPSRKDEGYGMNIEAIDKICKSGTKLIITVDNGIAEFDEAKHIKENGVDLIITDHHKIEGNIPECEAVINPHRDDNNISFCDLSGVGVALKLVGAFNGSMEDVIFEYADLAAIGTVADVMPLVDENRTIVKTGLKKINTNPIYGIKALKECSGYSDKEVTASALGFSLGPRINAIGRMSDARDAVELFLSYNMKDAQGFALKLDNANQDRKMTEEEIVFDIEDTHFKDKVIISDRVIVVSGKDYHRGVIGIVAARLTQKYGRPSVVISTDDSEFASGSARSIEGFNIFDAFSSCSNLFEKFGGHALAAGFTMKKDHIDDLKKALNNYALEKYKRMPESILHIDCRIAPQYLDLQLVKDLDIMEPCGNGNPNVTFALTGLRILSVTPIGKESQHIRLVCEKKGNKVKIVKFGTTINEFPFEYDSIIDVAANVSLNVYDGMESVSIKAVDIRKHGIDEDKFYNEKLELEDFMLEKNNNKDIYPSRDICAFIYRFMRARSQKVLDIDEWYFLIYNNGNINYGQLVFALAAFYECKLIMKFDTKYQVIEAPDKADLEKSKTMKYLKRRLGIG